MPHPTTGDTVKVHYTGRLDDGQVFDTSKERGPMELTVGEERVIPGFEEAVTQMQPGETKTVTIPAEKAYGPHRPDLVVSVERDQFPPEIQPEVGQRLQLRQKEGRVTEVRVADVSDQQVKLDANHPLAGRDLTFELELVAISGHASS
jgi:peptidylprolyl isomerase